MKSYDSEVVVGEQDIDLFLKLLAAVVVTLER